MQTFHPSVFRSFWMGGFESSCHVNEAGVRLDMLQATQHDRFVVQDYRGLRTMGLGGARDTVRWHRVEVAAGVFDFSSVDPYVQAADDAGVEVVWDLLHYGWPDGLDIYSDAFVTRFAGFCAATARHLRDRVSAPR